MLCFYDVTSIKYELFRKVLTETFKLTVMKLKVVKGAFK